MGLERPTFLVSVFLSRGRRISTLLTLRGLEGAKVEEVSEHCYRLRASCAEVRV